MVKVMLIGNRGRERERETAGVRVTRVYRSRGETLRRRFSGVKSPLNIDVPLFHATLAFYLSLSLSLGGTVHHL